MEQKAWGDVLPVGIDFKLDTSRDSSTGYTFGTTVDHDLSSLISSIWLVLENPQDFDPGTGHGGLTSGCNRKIIAWYSNPPWRVRTITIVTD